MQKAPLEIVGDYLLAEKLGEGGMGVVYRAKNRLSGQVVALKRVSAKHLTSHPAPSDTDLDTALREESVGIRTALAHEFQTLASLHHPHIVNVLDYGFDSEGCPFFTMELLESPQVIAEASLGKDIRYKIELLVQLLHALTYLHRRNILHRDIKPSNALVVQGQVKLLDFGIADFMGGNHRLAGTLQYMAPELFLGESASPASDLYALGVVAFQILTDRLPYQVKSRTGFLERLLGEASDSTLAPEVMQMMEELGDHEEPITEPVTPGTEAEHSFSMEEFLDSADEDVRRLGPILEKMLMRNPKKRYQDGRQVIHDLNQVLGLALPVETAATRESFLQAAEFVGREEELDALLAALKQAEGRSGSVWIYSGESGVGKSRFAKELRIAALVRSARTVQSRATTERAANYALWSPVVLALCLDTDLGDTELGILKDVAPGLEQALGRALPSPAALPPQAAQARLHAAVANLLRRQNRLVAIILEDLHWAGTESLELLAYLSPLVNKMTVLIMGNYRDDEASEQLRTIPAATQIRLGRLNDSQIGRLCASMLGQVGRRPELVSYLRRQTEGNVFFLVETVRALAEMAGQLDGVGLQELPEQLLTGGIERIIQRRLEAIPTEYHELLNLVAVAGRQLDLAVLTRATGQREWGPFLVACANAAVLEAERGDWQFSHDKIREWLQRNLNETDRRLFHRRVAEAILSVYPTDESQSAILGYHWDKANELEKAYHCYLKAGISAARLYAVVEARAQYSAALSAVDRMEDSPENRRRKVDALITMIGLSIQAANLPELATRLDEAENLLSPLQVDGKFSQSDAVRIVRIQFWKGRCSLLMFDIANAIFHCDRTCQLAKLHGIRDMYAAASLMIGQCKGVQGDFGACAPYLEQAMEWLESHAPNPDWIRTVGFQGVTAVARGQVQRGLANIDKALEAAKDPTLKATVHSYFCTAYMLLQDWPNAKSAIIKQIELTEQANDRRLAAQGYWSLARIEAWLGNPELFAEHCQRAHQMLSSSARVLGQDWFMAGEAEALTLVGQPAKAIELSQQSLALAQTQGSSYGQALSHRAWARALALDTASPWEAIEQHLEESMRLFEQGQCVLEVANTHAAWGNLASARGQRDRAMRHFLTAIEQYTAAQALSSLSNAKLQLEQLAGAS